MYKANKTSYVFTIRPLNGLSSLGIIKKSHKVIVLWFALICSYDITFLYSLRLLFILFPSSSENPRKVRLTCEGSSDKPER